MMVHELKKSQVMAEFILFIGIGLAVTIIFVAALGQNQNLKKVRDFFIVNDVALQIQDEIGITSDLEDGYTRQFTLPTNILNKDYNINISNYSLIVWTNTSLYSARILNVTITGKMNKGLNTIKKTNGVVYVN